MNKNLQSDTIQEEIDSLEGDQQDLEEAVGEAETLLSFAELNGEDVTAATESRDEAQAALDEWISDNTDRLKELNYFKDEVNSSEWNSGITFIPDSEFVSEMQELLESTGDIPRDFPSWIVIDWEATADNMRDDYTSVTFEGTEYWFRN